LTDQLYDATSPLAKKRILENMGLPTDINEDSSLQIDKAKQQWVDFVDDQVIPVIDPSIDNHQIRFQTLGTMILQDEGKQMAAEAGWDQILPLIAGWEDTLSRLEAVDARTREFYGGEPPPQEAAEMYAEALSNYEEQKKQFDTMVATVLEDAGPDGQNPDAAAAMPPPPQEPPAPVFLPKQIEIKIFGVWQQMIDVRTAEQPPEMQGLQAVIIGKANQTMQDPGEVQQKVEQFMRFRAVVDGYRLMAQKAQMAAMAPQVAPGSSPGAAEAQ
jgi:hypothetical protein